MIYKGYRANIEFDEDADIYYGEVMNISDVITFQGETFQEVTKAFVDSVEDYIEFCEELDRPHQVGST